MGKALRVVVFAMVAIASSFTIATQLAAEERSWEEGSVWTIQFVKTKPGKFSSYITDLSNVYRKYVDKLVKDGSVLSYKILEVSFPRDNEPDIIVLTEYRNLEVFDRGAAYFDGIIEQVLGSLSDAEKAEVNREELRSFRGEILTRQLKFKN